VIEQNLGKGEVDSSILSGSTKTTNKISTSADAPSGAIGNSRRNAARTAQVDTWRIGGLCSGGVRGFMTVVVLRRSRSRRASRDDARNEPRPLASRRDGPSPVLCNGLANRRLQPLGHVSRNMPWNTR
jgi:hypothetical protein